MMKKLLLVLLLFLSAQGFAMAASKYETTSHDAASSVLYGYNGTDLVPLAVDENGTVQTTGGGAGANDTVYGSGWNGTVDQAPSQNAVYDKIESLTLGAGAVSSVFGRAGDVVATAGDYNTTKVTEGTNLYYTDERVDDRVGALVQNGTGILWDYDDTGGKLTGNVTITQYTNAMAQATVLGLDNLTYYFNKTILLALSNLTNYQNNTANEANYFNKTRGNWKVFYSNDTGVIQELTVGAAGTFLKGNGATAAPSWDTPAGSGNVTQNGAVTADNFTAYVSAGVVKDSGASNGTFMPAALAKDLVTTAPLTGGTDNILPGADADITIAIPQGTNIADGYLNMTDRANFNESYTNYLNKSSANTTNDQNLNTTSNVTFNNVTSTNSNGTSYTGTYGNFTNVKATATSSSYVNGTTAIAAPYVNGTTALAGGFINGTIINATTGMNLNGVAVLTTFGVNNTANSIRFVLDAANSTMNHTLGALPFAHTLTNVLVNFEAQGGTNFTGMVYTCNATGGACLPCNGTAWLFENSTANYNISGLNNTGVGAWNQTRFGISAINGPVNATVTVIYTK